MTRAFDIGLSALRTHQTTLNVIGNNIANATTPGYHRQRVDLINRLPAQDGANLIGTGVEIGQIARVVDVATEDAILRNNASLGRVEGELTTARQIEALFAPGDNSIQTQFSDFFNALESVANSPETSTVRQELLTTGQQLVFQFREIENALVQHSNLLREEVNVAVDSLNTGLEEINQLNNTIFETRALGQSTADLEDRRDAAITELSQLTDVSLTQAAGGRDAIVVAGGVIAGGTSVTELVIEQGPNGLALFFEGAATELPLSSGRLRGVLNSINDTIPQTLGRLEDFAQTVVRSVDHQHALGLRDTGAFDVLRSGRSVDFPNRPIVNSGLDFPTQEGQLTLTVTDPATDTRTSHRIDFDPFTNSLDDVAGAINAIDGVNAVLTNGNGGLAITGIGDRQIDFAGRVDNVADTSSFAGTTSLRFSGQYNGPVNDELSVTFNGSGTIGQTPGLVATFRNSAGQVLATAEVGDGYATGSPFEVADGVFAQFDQGTVTATDTTSVLLTASGDTTGLLAALGINSLFSGSSVSEYDIRTEIIDSPDLLAISTSGQAGDSGNVAAIGEVRDARFTLFEDRTLIEELADFTAQTGVEAQNAQNQQSQLEDFGLRLDEQRAAISGVSLDEEFLQLLEVERAFQAASRFITAVDETLNDIFRIIG